MKLYLKALKLHFKETLEYKASFILALISQISVFFSFYFVIIALFDQFGNIKGFSLYEVLLCFSIIHIGYSTNEFLARGIDTFDKLIIKGSFDLLLLRPKNIILQVLIEECDFIKLSRIIQSIIILIYSLIKLNIEWNIFKVITLILMIIGAISIFFSIMTVSAAYCFITIQGLEVRNAFTDGGKYLAQYPICIYKKGIAFFFTFIIPYAFVNYYPVLYFVGREDNFLYAFSPLLTLLYLIPAIFIFYLGIKKYSSSGS